MAAMIGALVYLLVELIKTQKSNRSGRGNGYKLKI